MRGKMLWFNERKDLGYILTDDGERLAVPGDGFADGKRPEGRCAHAVVSFVIGEQQGQRQAENVVVLDDDAPRRARLRSRVVRVRV